MQNAPFSGVHLSSSKVGYNTDSLTGGKFYIKAAQFQDVQKGTATLNSIMNGLTGVDFDENLTFQTTAPQIQVQKTTGAGYDLYYYLNDAYIEGSSANCRKPFCPAATHPNTAGHFGKPRCRVGTPPLPGCIRRSALQPIIP